MDGRFCKGSETKRRKKHDENYKTKQFWLLYKPFCIKVANSIYTNITKYFYFEIPINTFDKRVFFPPRVCIWNYKFSVLILR